MIDFVLRALAGSVERAPWGWGLLALAIYALIVHGPKWNKQVSDAQAQKRSEQLGVDKEKRDDLRERIDALEKLTKGQGDQIKSLTAESQSYQLRLVSALSAVRLLAGYIEGKEPDNPILKQANDLIGLAASSDMGMGSVMDKLSRLPVTHPEGKA